MWLTCSFVHSSVIFPFISYYVSSNKIAVARLKLSMYFCSTKNHWKAILSPLGYFLHSIAFFSRYLNFWIMNTASKRPLIYIFPSTELVDFFPLELNGFIWSGNEFQELHLKFVSHEFWVQVTYVHIHGKKNSSGHTR